MLSSTIDELDVTSQAIIASPDDRETADYFPLSASQRRLWFLDRLEPGTGLYNVPALLRIRGNLNVEALEKSLNTIIARHETLRTSFELREDEPIQRIAPDLTLHLPIVDLSGRPQSEKEALELANLTLSQAAFDLTVAPLFQAKLFRIAPQHHLLAFVMHHIVCDGWSISVLVHEMSVLYTDFVQQGRSSLADLEIQYADWAAWEEDRLRGPLLQNQLSYWEHQLSESSPVLDLPVDFPRHSARMRAAHYASVLEEDLYHLLKNLAQENNTTLFVPLLACFQIVLSYYTGKKDISIGSPVANRNRRETETLIGCFINTLVLRTDLSGDPSLEEVLLRTKRTVLEAFDNQDIPIEKIVEALHPQRTADRTPLFQVMFTVQNTPVEKVEMPGLAIEFLQPAEVSIQHDMLISAIPQSGRLALTAEYRSELFSALTIDRMMQHYRRVVRFLATAPHLRMSEIAFLTSEEEWESAVKWNQTETSYPDDENIATLFERQARRTPDRPAVTFERQTLTYAELERRANRLARHLNSLGVGPEQIVGVFLGRDLDLVMVLLAIWKAGAAYLPLDPEYPQARIEQIVNNAAARLIITSQSLVDLLPAGGAQAICLDTDARVIEKQSDSALPVRVSGANLAYVIYTSGSTGKPKGVMIAHRSILNRVWWAVETFPLKSEDAILQKTPFSFDASIWEIFSPLLSGARLVIARPGGHRDPEYMISVIQQERITVLQLVPTMLNVLLREQGFANCTTLRRIFCGGEVLAPELVKQSRALLPAVQIQNLYGPTEASVDVSTYSCDPSTSQLQIPIGKPIANTSIYILDEHLNLVGVGVPGEICVAGDGLARGYLNSPDLTAVRFLPNPFAQHAGQRLYRTGDLGRRRNDGAIEYLGRLDNQVKLRGFRIELDEIDSVLCSFSGVRQSVTAIRNDEGDEPSLVSFVVFRTDAGVPPNVSEIRSFLRGRLPEYMIPAVITEIASIPHTVSGKVDRSALPFSEAGLQRSAPALWPRTETERLVAELVAELLNAESVGILDNFFELGGHSLVATRLVARIRDTFNVDMPLRVVFEQGTVESFSAYIDQQLDGSGRELSLQHAITRQPEEQRRMLSFAQQRLWILDQVEAVGSAYSLLFPVALKGTLDPAALSGALNEVVRRHEVLRTRFEAHDGIGAVAVVSSDLQIEMPILQIEGSPDEQRQRVETLIEEEMQRPFSLSQGPLLRAQLLRLSEDDHIALFSLHHMVSDAWSLNLFIEEISRFYRSYVEKSPAAVPELRIQYGDYAAWQRQWLEGEVLNRQIAYWKDQLDGISLALGLPTDYPRPAVQSYRGSELRFTLDRDLQKELKQLARQENATLFMFLLAAVQILLARYSGQNDISVGTPILSRAHPDTEKLIGLFSNTLVMRSRIDADESFREFLGRVREIALGAYANQDAPFEKLVEELNPERDRSRSPLFQVMFTLQSLSRPAMNLPGLEVTTLDVTGRTSKFDLAFFLEEDEDLGVAGFVEYNIDLFERKTIERMIGHWQELLHSIVANANTAVGKLNLLSAPERQIILEEWNRTDSDLEVLPIFADLFERQAAATPSKTAVTCNSESLTYDELNRRSNQLANYLRKAGAGAETLIGVCMERSSQMLIALIAVLKAGAAYVPLDPDYPEERISYMVEDANVSLLLTQESVLHAMPSLNKSGAVCLDRDFAQIAQHSESNPERIVNPGNPAYVIYTSGSTGRPKGVVVSQGNLAYFISTIPSRLSLTAEDVLLAITTICFDISNYELLVPITAGAQVVIRAGVSEGNGVAQDLTTYGITAVQGTPSFWRMFCDGLSIRPKLKIFCGGEALNSDLADTLLSLDCDITNMYGPTETTIWSATYPVKHSSTNIPVGRPIDNTTMYILDASGGLMPPGVAGEIFIGGFGLARGYLNRPALTAERYVPNPYSRKGGERLYRTGDLGRYRADGNIEYLGRLDQQVKVRGYRVELGEVETALRECPAVAEAAVAARDYGAGDKRLVGYVVWRQEAPPSSGNEVREQLRNRLPEYLVPSIVMPLDKLPLTRNGKLDRSALPEPEQASIAEYVEPRTEIEQVLAKIWADALKLELIGVHDNFFELGGHSLLVTQISSQIKQIFRLEVPLAVFFSSPTIAGLAGYMQTLESSPGRLEKIARIALQVLNSDERESVESLDNPQ